MPLTPPTLTGGAVQLEPLTTTAIAELVAAANEDRATYDWTPVPPTIEAMTRYVEGLLADHAAGHVVPFMQRRLADGVLVGCTRYMRLEWWGGRSTPDEIEVGGTWLSASAQRTRLNTEAKYLLFRHAFEVYGVQRLCLCTDARNQRSRDAIQRVGATFEGILRSHRGSYAQGEAGVLARDSAIFSITDREWPAVKAMLEAKLS